MATGIAKIQYGVLSAQEWMALGVEITTPSSRGNSNTTGTPLDDRLGILANGVKCNVCGKDNKECPGHWGWVALEEPCYNPQYIEHVIGILKFVCPECATERIPENMTGNILSVTQRARFKAYKKKAETVKVCSKCTTPLPNFFLDKYTIKMYYDGDKSSAIPITAREACAILMRVSSNAMKLFGYNNDLPEGDKYKLDAVNPEDRSHVHEIRPESFIFTVFPILPMSARPWVYKGSDRKEDDLTDMSNVIVKLNKDLKDLREAPTSIAQPKNKKKQGKSEKKDRKKIVANLQYKVWTYVDNPTEKGKVNNRQHKGIKQRLNGKRGRGQENVAGKRCDHSSRAVIVGGGDMLRMGELGVPAHVYVTQTVGCTVNEWNLEHLAKLLESGKINTVHRGSFTVSVPEVTANGTKPFIWKKDPTSPITEEYTGLMVGDRVNRQTMDGDVGFFNRQPTLRLEGMQGVKYKLLPPEEDVFRVPLGMTRPFNADFDGDEMNLHDQQSVGARAEVATICATPYHIVSAQNNAPVMGAVQNSLVFMYYITETFTTPEEVGSSEPNYTFSDGTPGYQTMLDIEDFYQACMAADIGMDRISDLLLRASVYYPEYTYEDEDGYLRFCDVIPGKIFASIVFPPDLTWSRKTDVNERLPMVVIEKGILLPDSGPLCKKSIGGVSGSTIHPIWKGMPIDTSTDGPQAAADMISEIQLIVCTLVGLGFSMGISDCIVEDEELTKKAIREAMIECDIINNSNKDKIEKEIETNGVLNKAMAVAPKLAKTSMNKKDRNALVIMKKSGAKGSDNNNGQIAGFVGQQNINGKRPIRDMTNGTRTLPHYLPDENGPESRGFAANSYLDGLNFKEAWFHAQAGRRGVVDTAHKTSDSGYIQKRIVNAINDFRTVHDTSVRNAADVVIQFAYGGDGLNSKELIPVKGLDYPFFTNPFILADCLNSKAERIFEEEQLGLKRELVTEEINTLLSFIQAGIPGYQSEVTRRITHNVHLILRHLVSGVRVYEGIIPQFCKRIMDDYELAKAKNGYMVGGGASSAIGEPTTQLSQLRSDKIPLLLKYHHLLLEDEEERPARTEYYCGPIGDIIDLILEDECHVLYHSGKDRVYSTPAWVDVYVNTVDPDTSLTSWKKVWEVSRHPANGGMVKVTTRSGRSTTTTLSHSHLRRGEDGVIYPVEGKDLKIGDFIPVCSKMNSDVDLTELNINGKIYPLDYDVGWLFGAYLSEGFVNNGQIGITNVSTEFKKRCEKFASRFGGKVRTTTTRGSFRPPGPMIRRSFRPPGRMINKSMVIDGVESKNTYDSTTHHISGCSDFGRYLVEVCNSGSYDKRSPSFALFAPETFVKGLLRGYFDGDGNVNSSRQQVRVHSVSRDLIETIALLLTRFGIFSTIGIEKSNRTYPLHVLSVLKKHIEAYSKVVGTDLKYKRDELDVILQYLSRDGVKTNREDVDVIPNIGHTISKVAEPLHLEGYSGLYKRHENKPYTGKETLRKYIGVFEGKSDQKDLPGSWEDDLRILKTAVDSEVIWDRIINIEYLDDPEEMVYDLGVTANHTFMMQSGIFTHNTLNTFHNTGVSAKDVTLGVPRLQELLNATGKPPGTGKFVKMKKNLKASVTVYLTDGTLQTLREEKKELNEEIKKLEGTKKMKEDQKMAKIEEDKARIKDIDTESLRTTARLATPMACLTVESLILDYELQYLPTDSGKSRKASPLGLVTYEEYEPEWWVTVRKDLGFEPKFEADGWVVLLKLDTYKLYANDVTVEDVALAIEGDSMGTRGYAMTCVPSPNVIGQIEVYLNFTEINEYEHFENKVTMHPDEITRHLVTPETLNYYSMREVALTNIRKTQITGIPGITKTYFRTVDPTGDQEWVIDTQGTNLASILGLPGVDSTRTISDSMWEIYYVLGIEATRKFLIREMLKILSFDGTYINPRHVCLVVDGMLRQGTISGINRDGIPRDVGPIAKGMFEETVDNFSEAAAFGEHDSMKGVASSTMYGVLVEMGTSSVTIRDGDRLPTLTHKPDIKPTNGVTKKRKPVTIPLKPKR